MPKTKIILITGKKQSGKDTSAVFLQEQLRKRGSRAHIFSFADSLKKIAVDVFHIPYENIYGDNDQKNEPTHIRWADLPLPQDIISDLNSRGNELMTGREFLQVFGSNICRKIVPDCWVWNTITNIHDVSYGLDYAILSDVRFPNELDSFSRATFSFLGIVNLDPNPIVFRLLRNPFDDNHYSEIALDDYPFDKLKHYIEIDNRELTQEEKEVRLLKHIERIL